jgi:hypothetical protein
MKESTTKYILGYAVLLRTLNDPYDYKYWWDGGSFMLSLGNKHSWHELDCWC